MINPLLVDLIAHTRKLNKELNVNEVYVDGSLAFRCSSEDWWLASLDKSLLSDENYTPSISIDTGNSHRYAAILRSDVTSESVEQDEPIYIIVYTLRGYNIIRLRFTTLPITTLTTDGTPTLEDDVPVELNGFTGSAHLRGRSTRIFGKKSYRITLDEKQSFLGMRNDDDWILYAGYNDQERIRNVFSSNLWYNSCAGNNQFGVENGYEYRYTELFLNGNYAGLYALGYKPDQKQFDIKIGEFLYSKTEWEDFGYELHGSKTKDNEAAAWHALDSDYLYDERSCIDLWLFTNLCAAMDNTGKNYYFALKKNTDGKLTAVYSPWDLDMTWGNEYNSAAMNYTDVYSVSTDSPFDMKEGYVCGLLNSGDRSIVSKLKARYQELRSSSWSDETLIKMLEEYESMIFSSGAYRRDTSTWAGSTQQDPELKLSVFREYLFSRLAWMDNYLEHL